MKYGSVILQPNAPFHHQNKTKLKLFTQSLIRILERRSLELFWRQQGDLQQ